MASAGASRHARAVRLRFENAVLNALEHGDEERFVLPAHHLAGLTRQLHFAVSGPHAPAEVDRALRLIIALESKLASPTAADQLREVLRGDAKVREVLKRRYGRSVLDDKRRFLAQQGRDDGLQAPLQDRVLKKGPSRKLGGGASPLRFGRRR